MRRSKCPARSHVSMSFSSLPECRLCFSPEVAAAIGLEPAILFQVLGDVCHYTGTTAPAGSPAPQNCRENDHGAVQPGQPDAHWSLLHPWQLDQILPFWDPVRRAGVASKLGNTGLVVIAIEADGGLRFRFPAPRMEDLASTATPIAPTMPPAGRQAPAARPIPADWNPDPELLERLRHSGVPDDYALDRVPEFVAYWRERKASRDSWDSVFTSWVIRGWRSRPQLPMEAKWQPSAEALAVLAKEGIAEDFALRQVGEFVLYWQERGLENSAWNSKFISHVRECWGQHQGDRSHSGYWQERLTDQQWADGLL